MVSATRRNVAAGELSGVKFGRADRDSPVRVCAPTRFTVHNLVDVF